MVGSIQPALTGTAVRRDTCVNARIHDHWRVGCTAAQPADGQLSSHPFTRSEWHGRFRSDVRDAEIGSPSRSTARPLPHLCAVAGSICLPAVGSALPTIIFSGTADRHRASVDRASFDSRSATVGRILCARRESFGSLSKDQAAAKSLVGMRLSGPVIWLSPPTKVSWDAARG